MEVFGFIVLCFLALVFTFTILFGICYGGEEFSGAGWIPSILGIAVIFAMWCALYLNSPFKIMHV